MHCIINYISILSLQPIPEAVEITLQGIKFGLKPTGYITNKTSRTKVPRKALFISEVWAFGRLNDSVTLKLCPQLAFPRDPSRSWACLEQVGMLHSTLSLYLRTQESDSIALPKVNSAKKSTL